MDILFKDTKIGKLCNNQAQAQRKYGKKKADNLLKILAEIRFSSNLAEFQKVRPNRHCHELKGDKKGMFAINLDEQYRILFAPSPEAPKKEDGGADWYRIDIISISSIEDYHD